MQFDLNKPCGKVGFIRVRLKMDEIQKRKGGHYNNGDLQNTQRGQLCNY